jgi:hypothetical protein
VQKVAATEDATGPTRADTQGLLNPDGILGVVPNSWPLKIIYEQKILSGDNTGATALPASQQCNTASANYYATNPFGTGVNDDITCLRLAETTDGIHFKDDGPLQGLTPRAVPGCFP